MELRGVAKRYGVRRPWVVRGCDLDLPPGRLVRVAGVNGSGKSTLLRLIAGATEPTRGQVRGRPRSGFVPERFPPALPLSAGAFLVHLGRVQGLPPAEARRRTATWLERFAITAYASWPMRTLSKGTSQKVAIAAALVAEPGLLVLDEAWTGLDEASRAVLDAEVDERVAAGGLVVYVDHDPRRLPGRPARHLRIEPSGTLTETDPPPVPDGAGPARPVLIEVAGYSGPVATLAAQTGVRSVTPVASGLQIRVDEGCSDEILRHLLAAKRAHVLSVRPEPDGPAPGAGR
ncbi:MAG TPA: ATP-binding cassette domain-containing protein [Acidimicrobiia bacterium]|nr:ATP-binding cassette domain-containing protein [Acidimicrobiia bacterium]